MARTTSYDDNRWWFRLIFMVLFTKAFR